MATEREIGFPIGDYTGVNRQVDREDIGNNDFWTMQNLWEKKINMLETRGGSVVLSQNFASNITGVDNVIRIFKNTLDHRRIVALKGLEESTGTTSIALPANVTLSFVNGGNWNASISGNPDIDRHVAGLTLRFYGYGYDKTYSVAVASVPGYNAGVSQSVQIVVSGAFADANITGIELYAACYNGGSTSTSSLASIWCGRVDCITTPTGTFTFATAPVGKLSGSASGQVGAIACEYTLSSGTNIGGTLIPGKTYYVLVLPQYLKWDNTFANTDNSYRQYGGGVVPIGVPNVLSVTLKPGENSIFVNYPPNTQSPAPPTFNNMLVVIGESPQLLMPIVISNVNVNNSTGTNIATILTFPINNPGVVDIEQLSSSAATFRYRQSDFSVNDILCRINNDGTQIPVFIARNSAVNRVDNSSGTTTTISVTADNTTDIITTTLTDPLPANTPVTFAGSPVPTGIISGQTYYWLTVGTASKIATEPNGTPVDFTTNGTTVTMTYKDTNQYPQTSLIYSGGFFLSQPLISQNYNFAVYQGLAYFVTGISNNPSPTGPGGFPNSPVSGTNYYVTDGNVAALVVFDYSSNPTALPSSTIISNYQEAIVVGGGIGCGDTVLFSLAANPFSFEQPGNPGINQFFQVEGLGEWVTGLSTFAYSLVYSSPQSFLTITKKHSTWILENLPTDFTKPTFLIQVSKAVGTPQGRTIIQTPIGVIFTHVDNVYLVKGGSDPVPIGDPISLILKDCDISLASSSYHDEQYKLSLYNPNYSGTAGFNNVEYWLDIKKMKQSQGRPDWKGPMVGRQIDFQEIENLTGDGTIYNQTRDRVCVDAENLRVFKADVIPAETDTQILDFATPVTVILESKDYKVQEQDNNWNKIFTRTYVKTRSNHTQGSPTSLQEKTYVDGVLIDTQNVAIYGTAGVVNFDDEPQTVFPIFPSIAATGAYTGRTLRKVYTCIDRIGFGGLELFYRVIRRRI